MVIVIAALVGIGLAAAAWLFLLCWIAVKSPLWIEPSPPTTQGRRPTS